MDRVRHLLQVEAVYQDGITGRGVTAAVLDTGVIHHPDYAGRIVKFKDFVNQRSECYDDASHGTHVTGIMAGDGSQSRGRYRGIAPECRIVALKVLDMHGHGRMEHLIRAIEWTVENRNKYDIRILNLSAGSSKHEADKKTRNLVDAVEYAWDAGITVIVAAGNMGPNQGTITVPGNSRKVITVGSVDFAGFQLRRQITKYSGCGPTDECVVKPDVVVPGTAIMSCCDAMIKGRWYERKSGTSMSAPIVAGEIALLLQKNMELTNVEIKQKLKESSVNLGLSRNIQGWGMPEVRKLTLSCTDKL